MPGTDTLKLFHDAFGYNSIRFVMILVKLPLDKCHYISAGSFTYTTRYKIHEVAYSTCQDGRYVLLFQQVGDPDWPFGHTHARIVLKDESGTITKYHFDVANDGANVHSDSWQVTWKEDCVEVAISGEEQNDNQYILCFNGKTDSNQLTKYISGS